MKRQDRVGGAVLFRGQKRDLTWRAAVEVNPADMWVGAYWKRTGNCIDLWICLLPCLPIHICWYWSEEPL